ncbi:hypothetical protein KIV40_09390 [Vibrio sp. D173a]|uniref:hypothetical protein n=1 Tax=Vibrio sp. D173a TaxID=2836349 RepID=UPI0025565536|nr:hypothetical protein [Vibrio sp. D173a]MDK9755635.1 hypothetical protein [Vibrio sp. D173a]
MSIINLLIVEDKDAELTEWKRLIPRFNVLNESNDFPFSFNVRYASTLEEAESEISNFQFDAAIIDIRLKEESEESNHRNTDGVDVFNKIINKKISFVTVYTAQSKDAEASIDSRYQNCVDIINRLEISKSELLKKLSDEHRVILEVIINLRTSFESSMAELFYESIWPRWDMWTNNELTGSTQSALTRHMATHLHASFLNETQRVHPEEYYFTGPMIHDKLDTGDITLVDNKHYILVTPRCEIAQDKHTNYQFVELEDKSVEREQLEAELAPLLEDNKQKKAAVKDHKKNLKALQRKQQEVIKDKNRKVSSISQAIYNKATATDEAQITQFNLRIADLTELLLEIESELSKTVKDIIDKESELEQAEKELKTSDNSCQRHRGKINGLFPSAGVKISRHILPEVKQPGSVTYGPLHAQFEKITYIAKDSEEVQHFKAGKYARLSNEFIPSFVERLGSHFSRIGTPDYSHPE